jgi:hypothetical protein
LSYIIIRYVLKYQLIAQFHNAISAKYLVLKFV